MIVMPPRLAVPALLFCAFGLAACGGTRVTQATSDVARDPNVRAAARICADSGGRLEVREEQAGRANYCHMRDGTVIEEWRLYRDRSDL